MNRKALFVTALSLLVAGSAFAQRNRDLEVGDNAPQLSVDRWVKGEETKLQQGQVYVIEFWATWCVPCQYSIPHLSKLQENYEDEVTIIGISDEQYETVRPFVRRQGPRMNYTVGIDDGNRTGNDYMRAANVEGIPAAFIIDRNLKVMWIGNPLDEEFEEVLHLVRADRYDPRLMRRARPILEAAERARDLKDWRMMNKYYDDVIEMDPRVFNYVAKKKFRVMLHDMDDPDGAIDYLHNDLMKKYAQDPETLSFLAEEILKDASVLRKDERLAGVALELAEAGASAARSGDPLATAILAKAHYHNGDYHKAFKLQSQAYFLARPKYKENYKKDLETYRQKWQANRAGG